MFNEIRKAVVNLTTAFSILHGKECIKFTSWDGYNIFCDSKTMGSFLPDVASSGLEIIKIDEPEPQKKQNSIEKYCAGKTTPTHEIEKSF